MLDRLATLPFWQAFVGLFAIVLVRSNVTYWVGRGAMAGRRRRHPSGAGQLHRTVERQARAAALLRRLGPVMVTLSYLTVGIQTAVHLAAGAMRMPFAFYLPASVIGSAAWAALYATIGLAVVQAWIAAEAGSWYGLGALAGVVLVGLATWWLARGRARRP